MTASHSRDWFCLHSSTESRPTARQLAHQFGQGETHFGEAALLLLLAAKPLGLKVRFAEILGERLDKVALPALAMAARRRALHRRQGNAGSVPIRPFAGSYSACHKAAGLLGIDHWSFNATGCARE